MRVLWKLGFALAVLGVAAILLSRPGAAELFNRDRTESIYVVLKTTGRHMEFWQIVRAGIQAAATEYDVDPRIVGPRWEKNVDKQIEIFNEVIEEEPDGVLLAASDYNELVLPAEKAAARGIELVTLDSALNSDVPTSFVATDNVEAGRKAGTEIDRLVPEGEKIAVISHIRGVATAIDREEGVRSVLQQERPGNVLPTYYTQNEPERGEEIVRRLLREYGDLGGIVALNENSTVGVGRALQALGKAGEIKAVGFDNSREEIEYLEDGVVQALVVQKPFNMGYLGIKTLIEILRGEEVPEVIHTESVLVRKEDMFTPENQKLLFPLVRSR